MSLSEEQLSQIERYIDGDMTMDERQAFEQQMEVNAELKMEVAMHQKMVQSLKNQVNDELRTELRAMLKSTPESQPKRKMYWWAAAALLVLAIAFTFNQLSKSQKSDQELFAQYFQPYAVSQTRGNAALQAAFEDYSAQNWTEAIPALEQIVNSHDSLARFRLYLGSAYLSTGQTAKSIQSLTPLLTQEGSLKSHARWYVMLAYLKQGQVDEARRRLEEIIAARDDYLSQAQNLHAALSD